MSEPMGYKGLSSATAVPTQVWQNMTKIGSGFCCVGGVDEGNCSLLLRTARIIGVFTKVVSFVTKGQVVDKAIHAASSSTTPRVVQNHSPYHFSSSSCMNASCIEVSFVPSQ